MLVALDFLDFGIGQQGYAAVGGVAHDVVDNVGHLLLQFGNELGWVVGFVLYVAQLLLPDTCQFTTLEQFLVNEVDEFNAGRGCHESLAFALDVVALEQGFDDAGTAGWATDAVLLHGRG